jgi:Vitamin K-dependent gamma-carboxylase
MKGPWAWWTKWVSVLATREGGQSLAAVRVIAGLAVLSTLLPIALTDMVPLLWLGVADGGYRNVANVPWRVEALGGQTPPVVWGLVIAGNLAGVSLALGLRSRMAALIAGQSIIAVTWLNGHAGGSHDALITNLLWLLVLADAGATCSLDCRMRSGRWVSDRQVAAWPRWLLVVQLVLMYASTGSQKLSAHWVPGGNLSALYYILQQPTWQRVDMQWLAPLFPLTQALTAATWFFEVTAPLLLVWFWARRSPSGPLRRLLLLLRWRGLFASVGIGMHIGIWMTMEVGPFTWISLAFYPALVHPDEWRRALSWFRQVRAGRRQSPATTQPSG